MPKCRNADHFADISHSDIGVRWESGFATEVRMLLALRDVWVGQESVFVSEARMLLGLGQGTVYIKIVSLREGEISQSEQPGPRFDILTLSEQVGFGWRM